MHDRLWAGVELKLSNARFHFTKMGQSLGPPENTHMNVVLQSSGAIIGTHWQHSFYAHLDAFLSAARSIAEIIKCCFGHDRHWQMKGWFDKLSSDEKDRRRKFSQRFLKTYTCFTQLPLSTARHISEHRTGYPDVTVAINGMLGVTYTGSPIDPVPVSETRRIADPELAFLAKPHPVCPMWTDFQIDGQGLFEVCNTYLGRAQDLIDAARAIAQQVHDNKVLTLPS
jgi:hypothetical protein